MVNDTRTDGGDPTTNITTDQETIRTWVDESGVKPGYRTGESDERELYLYHPDEETTDVDETTWEEFFHWMDDEDMVFVRHTDRTGAEQFELLNQTEAIERATLDDEEVERALMEGETVRSEITETKVIERTVQETETIESEVVDSEIVRDEIIDTELIRREISNIHVGEDERGIAIVEDTESVGWEEDVQEIDVAEHEVVTIDVDETHDVTRELIERKTVESRVVARDVEGTETVESDTLEGRVDLEGVHRTIIESDILGGEVATEEFEGGPFESEFTEDETILTELYERRLVRDEVVDRKQLTFELVSDEVLSSETITSTLVETELLGSDRVTEIVEGDAAMGATERTTTADTQTTGTETETAGAETDPTTAGTETGSTDVETVESGSTVTDETTAPDEAATANETTAESGEGMGDTTASTVTLDDHDVGKDVIDANDQKIGVVTEVDEGANRLFVDPNPGLAERIKTRLGWEGHDDDAYSVEADRIDDVTGDEVRLRNM